jgi:prephenate dehydrogenase
MVSIAVIGMGMIGTSLAMGLRAADEKTSPLGPISVVGFDADKRAASEARGRLAIDRAAGSLEEAVRDAQIVVLATPVQAIRDLLSRIAPMLQPGAVVTDTASTKAAVQRWAEELLPPTVDFIGGHPMAGKEQTGVAAAQHDLFADAIYCLTPSVRARQEAIDAVEAIVTTLGAKPYFIDPLEHDAYVGGVSHLPFLLSLALVEATSRSSSWREMAPLAASGFRDISRLASGDVTMHRDICLTNGESLTRWINEAVTVLLELRDQIGSGNAKAIEAALGHAKEVRDAWIATRPNQRPGEGDFEGPQEIRRTGLFGVRVGKKDKG